MSRHAFLAISAGAILVTATSGAHEFWLAPARYGTASPHASDSVLVAAYVGTGFRGDFVPYAPTHTVRLELHDDGRHDLRDGAVNGDFFLAAIRPDPGGDLLCYETTFRSIDLAAPEFQSYLALEGLDDVLQARHAAGDDAKPGRERYRRAAKTWITGSDASRVTRATGLPLELVPSADPSLPATLALRVLYEGKPLADALVRAWNQPFADVATRAPAEPARRDSVGPVASARTDRDGRVTLALDRPGEWLISTVHMVPSADRDAADWESTWASLTFARPESARGAAPSASARTRPAPASR